MAGLTVSLLGPFAALVGDEPLSQFRTKSVQALLIYLLCEPGPHGRESLMALLWPEVTQASAQNSLRQALYHLRQAVPELPARSGAGTVPAFLADRQTVQVNPEGGYDLDVNAFRRLLDGPVEQWPEAVALYRGEFLQEFYLPDSAAFENWVSARRSDYRRRALEALDRLVEGGLGSGAYETARGHAQRQLEIDNLYESAHRSLLTALARLGQRNLALAHYEEYTRLMAEELDAPPSPKMKALYERILAGELGTAIVETRGVRGYDLLEEIGAGAFGAVHRAYQPVVGREVAVKVILPHYANHPDFIRRFEAEAQIVARLEHPHIVPLYDYWREPDGAYLVMRYLRGGSVADAVEAGPWEPAQVARLLEQVGGALATAHRAGVVHRDIKPANILLDEEGNSYLSDFGIAKDLGADGQGTATGAMLGSPAYISPEQALNQPVTPLTDIYSLGVVLFVLLTGRHPFPDLSLAALLQKHLNEPLPLAGALRPELPPEVDDVIRRATAKNPAGRYEDVLSMVAAFKEAIQLPEVGIDLIPAAEMVNPYKGLRPFQEADAADFFGREALVQQLLARMGEAGRSSAFLALVGPSGSGKSSVVKAGLLPALRQGALPGSDQWYTVQMTPGSRPLDEVEIGLLRVATGQAAGLGEQLRRDAHGLVRAARLALPDDDASLFLVIDQFEELFTAGADPEERDHFLALLASAAAEARSPLRILITLRADFYDRPLLHPEFGRLVRDRTEVVLPLTVAELTEAVLSPARQAGAEVEPDLVATIVADVAEEAGALPMFQYALTELFAHREGRRLTAAAYRAIGGVSGALAARAEELFAGLDGGGQEAARQLFLRLITLGEGIEDTRRRVLRSELEALENDQLRVNNYQFIIDHFGAARLLTFDRDPATREPTVEVAHEALLREWGRLRGWLDESRADVRQERLLAAATAEWLANDRDSGFLMHGARLDQFEGWAEGTSLALTAGEEAFLSDSLEARRAREAAEEARRRRELETAQQLAETERRRAEEGEAAASNLRRRAFYLGGALVVAAVLAVAALFFARQSNTSAAEAEQSAAAALASEAEARTAQAEAEAARQEAEGERERADDEAQAALAEADARATAEAIAVQERESAQASERKALEAYSLSLAANARQALEAGEQDLALLLALAANTIEEPPRPAWRALMDIAYVPGLVRQLVPDSLPFAVAASPDGSRLLSSGDPALLWDAASGEILQRLEGAPGDWAVAFTPDGQKALVGSEDGSVVLWDLESGQIERQSSMGATIRSAAITPDGRRALLGLGTGFQPGELVVWDLESGDETYYFGADNPGLPEGVRDVAIGPDGRTALIGLGSATPLSEADPRPLVLWDMATGEIMRTFEGLTRSVNGVDISPDGRLGLANSADGVVYLFDLETGELLRQLEGHTIAGIPVVFSPDGRTALSGSVDQTIIWWDLGTGEIIRQLRGHTEPILKVDFIDDTRAVSQSLDGTLRIWDLTNRWQEARWGAGGAGHRVDEGLYVADVVGREFAVQSLAISPDGRQALSGGGVDDALLLWEYETGALIRRLEGHQGAIADIAFTPDGGRALSASLDGSLIFWDLESGEPIGRLAGHAAPVLSVAISGDGRYALSGDGASEIIYWDLAAGEAIRRLIGHSYGLGGRGVTDILFLPGDRQAVSGGKDSSLIVWDLASGRQVKRLTGFEGDVGDHWNDRFDPITAITLGPDGRQVLSAGDAPFLLLWDLISGKSIRRYDGLVRFVAFNPDGRTALSSTNGELTLWDVEHAAPLRRYPVNDRLQSTFKPPIAVHPNGQTALSGEPDGTILKWRLAEPDPATLLDWLEANRALGELTCLERETYQVEPLCVDGESSGTTADLLTAVREATDAPGYGIEPGAGELATGEPLYLEPPPPPAVFTAEIGDNRGQLGRHQFDVWTVEGEAGQILSVHMAADSPADLGVSFNDFFESGVLETSLIIVAPDGSQLATNDRYLLEDESRLVDARLDHVRLPLDGVYRIQARSGLDDTAGGYTLTVGLRDPVVVDPAILEGYTGLYLQPPNQLDISIYVQEGDLIYNCLPCVPGDDIRILIPVSDDEFALNDGSRIIFTRDDSGAVAGYDILVPLIYSSLSGWHQAEKIEEPLGPGRQ